MKRPPDALAQPIKHAPERARREMPTAYLEVQVDGRESSYFEWLGAGLYATDRRSGAMHGRQFVLGDLSLWIRRRSISGCAWTPSQKRWRRCRTFQLRVTVWDSRETRITLGIEEGESRREGSWSTTAYACCVPEAVDVGGLREDY